MPTNSLLIASRERHAGGLAIAIGFMDMLRQRYEKIAFFRPIVEDLEDPDSLFMQTYFQLPTELSQMVGFTLEQATQLISQHKKHDLYEQLIEQYQKLSQTHDFVIVQGMDLSLETSQIEFDINAKLSKHFDAPLVPVINAQHKTLAEVTKDIEMEITNADNQGCEIFAIFANQIATENMTTSCEQAHWALPVCFLPYQAELNTPTVHEIIKALDGELLFPSTALNRLAKSPVVAAMTVENYLSRVKEGDLVIVPGDRTDILTASIMSLYARNLPNIAGIVLTGGIQPAAPIMALLEGFNPDEIPIITVKSDTYPSAMQAHDVKAHFHTDNPRKTQLTLGLFEQWVEKDCLLEKLIQAKKGVTTPIMFEYSLFERAKQSLKTIVLPEAEDERILRACELLLKRQVVKPVLLGNPEDIQYQCNLLGLDLSGANIIDPKTSEWREDFIETFYQMRKHKGMTRDLAKDFISHISYFATMMVYKGYADGMVSGATHTTADTVRPALQIIKTQANTALVSSVFFMCFETRVLVYGDCAVNQNPNAEALSDIAISSADTAKQFGIDPKVALLSYSTGASGKGEEVEKVRYASQLAQSKRPDILLEGPLQYDAAIDAKVAQQKLPNSQVAGKASVFIFPDLNTGNNTYKAVQRASGAIAIGPVLQGLNKPVNDLSRGCLVDDIVNTVAITAIQAQNTEGNL